MSYTMVNSAPNFRRSRHVPTICVTNSRCLADLPGDRFSTMAEVCKLLRGITTGDASNEGITAAVSTVKDDGENVASDRLRTGMILNEVGVSFYVTGDEANNKHA